MRKIFVLQHAPPFNPTGYQTEILLRACWQFMPGVSRLGATSIEGRSYLSDGGPMGSL